MTILEIILILINVSLGYGVIYLTLKLIKYKKYFRNMPKGRVGIYYFHFYNYYKPKQQKEYKLIIEVEELEIIESKNKNSLSKIKVLNISPIPESPNFLSKIEKRNLIEIFPKWIKTNDIIWKKSPEQLLIHPVQQIRDKAYYQIKRL